MKQTNTNRLAPVRPPQPGSARGYTLLETVVVLTLLALLISLVAASVFGGLKRSRLDSDVAQFARTMRLAAEQAVLTGETFAVAIEIYDGYYEIYEDNDENVNGANGDIEPLIERQSLDRCWIDEIEFEDGSRVYSGEVVFRATPEGWKDSLIFRIKDRDDRWRYIRCDKFTTNVTVARKPLELLQPQESLSMRTSL